MLNIQTRPDKCLSWSWSCAPGGGHRCEAQLRAWRHRTLKPRRLRTSAAHCGRPCAGRRCEVQLRAGSHGVLTP
eukprot:6774279-Alexandrium_andersonii.AAC.1